VAKLPYTENVIMHVTTEYIMPEFCSVMQLR